MANWISSKLKAAESILQQIDQQAAESLGKGELPRSPPRSSAADDAVPRRSDPAVSLKNQLPTRISHSPRGPRPTISSTSYAVQPDKRPISGGHGSGIDDRDWTELLGPPTPVGHTFYSPLLTRSKKSNKSKPERKSGRDHSERKPDPGICSLTPAQAALNSEIPPLQAVEDVRRVHSDSNTSPDIGAGTTPAKASDDKEAPVSGDDVHSISRKSASESEAETTTDASSSSSSDSEEERRKREDRKKRKEQVLAEQATIAAAVAIKDREDMLARFEGEQHSLTKILEEREKQQAQEALELQSSMLEAMEAVEQEKLKHNTTRMEAFARLAKLETENSNLAILLATTQQTLEVEAKHVAELQQQLTLKESFQKGHNQRLSRICSSSHNDELQSSKKAKLEKEILDAEFSLVCDKIMKLTEKARKLGENIEIARKDIVYPTEVEVELKRRLAQLTDRLIQKQAQVESLSSDKAAISFKIEALSRWLNENGSSAVDIEAGIHVPQKYKPQQPFGARIKYGKQQIGSIIHQLDAIFCAGMLFLKRNRTAMLCSVLYFVSLHVWVMYILLSRKAVPEGPAHGTVYSLETINSTASA